MSEACLENVIRKFLVWGGKSVRFIWHGGEPLLGGIDFFQKAIALQQKYQRNGQKLRNSVQTNATLLTPEWADFFLKNDFHVGVSLDGPKDIHDYLRTYPSGHGSFDYAIQGIENLQWHNLKFGTLAVVSRRSLNRAAEIFDFFRGINIKSYDLLPYADLSPKGIPESVSADEFAAFMIRIADLWMEFDDPEIEIRYLENALAGLLGKKPFNCTFDGSCPEYLAVAADGGVYHCDWFIGQNDKCFGNINDCDLDGIVGSPEYFAYISHIKQPKVECKECQWQAICNGGCAHHREMLGDFQSPYYFCNSRKMILQHLADRLKPALSKWGIS